MYFLQHSQRIPPYFPQDRQVLGQKNSPKCQNIVFFTTKTPFFLILRVITHIIKLKSVISGGKSIIMARKQDEMSLDDELTAAFLSDSDMPALTEIEEDSEEIPEDTPNYS